jgi:hypothetical protein
MIVPEIHACVVLLNTVVKAHEPAASSTRHASTIATTVVHPLVYDGGADVLKRLKTCTKLEPTTTTRKKAINTLETGNSSSCSAALPIETFPRLLMFLSNLSFRLRILRGRGCSEQRNRMGEVEHIVSTVYSQRQGEARRVQTVTRHRPPIKPPIKPAIGTTVNGQRVGTMRVLRWEHLFPLFTRLTILSISLKLSRCYENLNLGL